MAPMASKCMILLSAPRTFQPLRPGHLKKALVSVDAQAWHPRCYLKRSSSGICTSSGLYRAPVSSSVGMEVEVKLTLADAAAHQRVAELLAPYHKITHLQENIFFDGAGGELGSKRAVLRLRFYNGDARCVVSLKAKAVLANGVSRVEEEEEDLDVALGRACVPEPGRLASVDNNLIKKVVAEFGCREFVCLGGFRNVRNVFEWEGETLELDETQYSFGTSYEIECETPDPERVKSMLEAFLAENGIPYSHSVASKFAVFRSGKLP